MYNCSSSQSGTLFQLRNLVDCRNVVKDVCSDINATEDFLRQSELVTATLNHFNMKDMESAPCNPHKTSTQMLY